MIRVRRTLVAVVLTAVAAGSPGVATAQQPTAPQSTAPQSTAPQAAAAKSAARQTTSLPPGWEISGAGPGAHLTWHAAAPVPMGDADLRFYAGDRPLGRPAATADLRTFTLALDGVALGSAKDLQVRAGSRRLDAAGTAQRRLNRRSVQPPAGPGPLTAPLNPVDPGVPGPYRTVTGEYTLSSVALPGLAAPVEMRAVVVSPAGAPGRRPLALFLHGRHYVCFTADGEVLDGWPCPEGADTVPSYRGYLRDQKLLASQGYDTVSLSANGVNAQDDAAEDGGAQARSSLVRLHLARWADWAGAGRSKAPAIVRSSPPADLSRVLLIGHSRGGEGVNRAAIDSLNPPPAAQDGYRGKVRWHISGTLLIGPTIFGQNPAADVPSATILPGCDGDVSDLQGEIYVDGTRGVSAGTALHSAVYVEGANHNFFNSEWTPGQAEAPADDDFWSDEDAPDPLCAPGRATRLTAVQQQAVGATYAAAAARVFVAGDDRARPLLDGSHVRAASAGAAHVLTHAVGAGRRTLVLPDASVAVTGATLCAQVDPDPAKACLGPDVRGVSPHFAMWQTAQEAGRHAVRAHWSAPGSVVRLRPAHPVSLAGARDLALRLIVPPNSTGTRLDVALTDAGGRRANLGRISVDGLPGTERTASYWGQEVRVPLTAAVRAKLDLGHVKALELTPRSTAGTAWLMDASGWRPGLPAVHAVRQPRIDVGPRLTVGEGDAGVRSYQVPVNVSGHGTGQVRLFVSDPATGATTSRLVTVRPGSHSVDATVRVPGNTRFGYGATYNVLVKAVRNAVVGADAGGVDVTDDDPMPAVAVLPVADRVTEGRPLTWRVTLSAPADADLWLVFDVQPVSGAAELSTVDVDPDWFTEYTGESPLPGRPLSSVDYFGVPVLVPAGEPSADLTVPTVKDTVTEPDEQVRLREEPADESGGPPEGPVITGTVLDAR